MTGFGSLGLAVSYGLGAQAKTTTSEHWRVYLGLGQQRRKDEKPLSILPSFQGIVLNYALSFTGVTVISHIPIMGNIKSRNLSISSVSTNMK
tara:strand:- start:243 stop:518 length:276 start_codon:yes stop_codon:yes gene_type:complete